ncbi:unnamed protein product [Timema podura]|uniref:omega-amidase n=1 Tax=Timema podura TaxID=61482 RepID=A0ABN7NP94_TIMPD|nr:unnamed protein product [Timema podura]
MAAIQLKVSSNKMDNLMNAIKKIEEAAKAGANIAILPESWNTPYGTEYFSKYAEEIPKGMCSNQISIAAKENEIFVVAGSIPEKCGHNIYNTTTVWNQDGQLVAKYRKIHLFDIDIPGGITFKESDTLSPGNEFVTFSNGIAKFGLGICYDVRFTELANIYRQKGCSVLIYPGSFNKTTGPLHWELLHRARAVDTQSFVVGVAPAEDIEASYVSHAHSLIVDPMGIVISQAGKEEEIIYAKLDMEIVKATRCQIPVFDQRRTELYETIQKPS